MGTMVGPSVRVGATVTLAIGLAVLVTPVVNVTTGVFVDVRPGPGNGPPPPLLTRVCVMNTGNNVRVGVAERVAVYVIVAVGVKVWVAPVFGSRKARNGWVGSAVNVGVKNIMAKACWVIARSADKGVAVYLGSRTSVWISGAPPYTRNGSRSAKNNAPASTIQMITPSVLLFTGIPRHIL
jgi:hypothetical protein